MRLKSASVPARCGRSRAWCRVAARQYRRRDGQPQQHQPLADRRSVSGAGNAERRRAEIAENQHPVQRRVDGHAEQQHDHHDPRPRQRREQAAQHRKAEKTRRAPDDRTQIAADLSGQRAVIADQIEQRFGEQHRRDNRHRQRGGEDQPRCRDPSDRFPVPGTERERGQRRDRVQHAGADQHGGKITPAMDKP